MAQFLYTMEAVNLICGDVGTEAQPGYSTHLVIREMKLPNMEEQYVDHVPGGGTAAIEVPSHLGRLESTFTLAGWKPEVMTMLASSVRQLQRFTAYGLIREQRSGEAVRSVALMWGRLGHVNPSAFRRGDMMEHAYSIRNITHYELAMEAPGGVGPAAPIYYWDFFENRLEVGGVNVREVDNNILGITGTAPGIAGVQVGAG
jgi:phage tail tube protein FII